MQLHELTKAYKTKAKKRVGRGGKRGTYSGKGQKGQKSRAGKKIRPAISDYIIRLPRKRGLGFNSLVDKPAIVDISKLNDNFTNNEVVSPKTLVTKGLIKRTNDKLPRVKILGTSELKKKLIFKDCLFSKTVASKIK